MAEDTTAFVIPKGLQFESTDDGIVISHTGDIVLQGELGSTIQRITSTKGNIHISIPLTTQEICAPNGTVFVNQPLTASKVEGKHIKSLSDLTVSEELLAHVDLDVDGAVRAPRLICRQHFSATGSVEIDNLAVEGNVSFSGNYSGNHLHVGGNLSTQGNLDCRNVEVLGTSLQCAGSISAQEVIADQAKMVVEQAATVQLLRAHQVLLNGAANNIKALKAADHVNIAESEMFSDIILCNSIKIHPKASGKIMVLESLEQLGPHSIKGCLQLSDLEELIPNIDNFLVQRGLHQRDTIVSAANVTSNTGSITIPKVEQPDEADEAASKDEEGLENNEDVSTFAVIDVNSALQESDDDYDSTIDDDELSDEDVSSEEIVAFEEEVVPAEIEEYSAEDSYPSIDDQFSEEEMGIDAPVDDEQTVSPISVEAEPSNEEELTYNDESAAEFDNPLHQEIKQEVLNVAAEYQDEPPVVVSELVDLMNKGDFLELREEIMKIWKRLLNHHQRQNTRLPPKVIDSFNQLNAKLARL